MAIYLLGSLTKDVNIGKYIPIGVTVRDGEDVAFNAVDQKNIPQEYIPESDGIIDFLMENLDAVFTSAKGPSRIKTPTIKFELIAGVEEVGSLEERANRLFEEKVLPHYIHSGK